MPGEKKELLPVRLKTGADRSAAGRNGQLHIGFGGASSPDCRGITVAELQGIDFNKLDFTNFMEDLINNQKIPDNSELTEKTKARIKELLTQSSAK